MQETSSTKKQLCKSCDLVVSLPKRRSGYSYVCPQCHSRLIKGTPASLYNIAVVSIASVIMLFTAITLPFMTISSMGLTQSMSLTSIFFTLRKDWSILLYIFILFTFICPLLMHSIVIGIVFFKCKVTLRMLNIYQFCHRFCMVDVFILGVLVSLIKLMALVDVSFHMGFYCALIFALLMVWCYAKGSPYLLWDLLYKNYDDVNQAQVGVRGKDQGLILCRHCGMVYKRQQKGSQVCPRCLHKNDYRARRCYQKTIALLIAAIVMYVPSNIYPIMFTGYLGIDTGSNIIDGVISLWGMESYFVALVILVASICIPVLKIISIMMLMVWSYKGFKQHPSQLNKLYGIVLFIGRWSMIDVFVVIIMSTVVRISGLLVINPGLAIVCFCMVVLITMFAAEEYDERLLWDKYFEQNKVLRQYKALKTVSNSLH